VCILSSSAKTWHQRRPWVRVALAAFVVMWLNFAVQTRLMAMELPADATTEMGHSSHAGHSSSFYYVDRPPAMGDSYNACATSFFAAACSSNTPIISSSVRAQLRKFQDASPPVLIAESSPTVQFVRTKDPVRSLTPINLSYPSAPPLNIRHCVFLI